VLTSTALHLFGLPTIWLLQVAQAVVDTEQAQGVVEQVAIEHLLAHLVETQPLNPH
jgi:hypothetical protein